jgi:hypothetical protein
MEYDDDDDDDDCTTFGLKKMVGSEAMAGVSRLESGLHHSHHGLYGAPIH